MAAGKAAAARLRQAGRAGEEEEDLEDSATAFEDDLAEGESSAPLAAVSAVATPLPRRDSAARPMLQREGQISTHLFHVELPSESPLSSRVRARLTARVSGAAAAEDVSLGRAVLRWRRQAAAGATPAPAELVATSSCDLPVLTVQRAPVVAELVAPLVARAGAPIGVKVVLENRTGRTETLSLGVGRSADFSLAGLSETQCSVRAPWPHPARPPRRALATIRPLSAAPADAAAHHADARLRDGAPHVRQAAAAAILAVVVLLERGVVRELPPCGLYRGEAASVIWRNGVVKRVVFARDICRKAV